MATWKRVAFSDLSGFAGIGVAVDFEHLI